MLGNGRIPSALLLTTSMTMAAFLGSMTAKALILRQRSKRAFSASASFSDTRTR